MADALYYMPQRKGHARSFSDLQKEQNSTRTKRTYKNGDEIALDIIKRGGLHTR